MSDEKLLNIQEKIYAERQKIQEKLQKNIEIPQKNEEKSQKSKKLVPKNIYPASIEESKRLIKESVIDRDFDQEVFNEHNYHNPGSGKILGGIIIMIMGFSILTLGNYIISTISTSLTNIQGEGSLSLSVGTESLMSYILTVTPLMGLSLMILGFGAIFLSLRSTL